MGYIIFCLERWTYQADIHWLLLLAFIKPEYEKITIDTIDFKSIRN